MFARFAIAASTLAVVLAMPPCEGRAAERPYPFGWDATLWGGPRPSPLPVHYKGPKDFHREVVSPLNGGLTLHFVDLLLPNGSLPVMVQRHYRSGSREIGALGLGWSSNLDVRLLIARDRTPVLVESNGQVFATEPQYAITGIRRLKDRAEPVYDTASGPIGFEPIGGASPHWSLERDGEGWKRILMPGVVQRFDRAGRLIEQRAGDRDVVRLAYADADARHPSEMTDAAGRTARFTYRDGLLVQADFPPNRTVRYVYTDRYLTEVIDPIGRKTTLTYANAGISRMVLPDGADFAFRYGADLTLQEVSGPGALRTQFAWQADSTRGGFRLATTPSFGAGESLEITPTAVSPRELDKKFPITQALGLQFRRTKGGQELGTATLLPRDLQSLLGSIVVKTPAAQVLLKQIGYSADADSQQVGDDIDGWRIRFTPMLAPRRDSKLTYDSAGRAVGVALDSETRETWKWDDADRIVEWSDADGIATRYAYNAGDRLIRLERDGRLVLTADYNALGLIAKLHRTDGGDKIYAYDANGNILSVSDGRNLTEFATDHHGRPTEARIDGKLAARMEYGPAGELTSLVDSKGDTTRYRYDSRGNIVEVQEQDRRLSYRYDQNGRLTQSISSDGSSVEATYLERGRRLAFKSVDGQQTVIETDQSGRIVKARLRGGPEHVYAHDADGRLVRATEGNGSSRTFLYTSDGRLESESGSSDDRARYEYDRDGRLSAYYGGGESIQFSYGDNGVATIASRRSNGTSEIQLDGKGRFTRYRDQTGAARTYSYDFSGLRSVTGPAEDVLRYERDQAGRVIGISHDMNGRSARKQFKRDDAGRIGEIQHEDGTSEKFSYDPSGRLIARTNRVGSTFRYTYTADALVQSIEGPTGVERFEYDARGRTVVHDHPVNGTLRYSYSADGKRVTIVDSSGARTTVTLDDLARPITVTDALSNTMARTYDQSGNLVAFDDPRGNRSTFSYQDGRLVEARSPLGKTIRYRYDDRGLVVGETRPGGAAIERQYDALGRVTRISTSDGDTWDYEYDSQSRLVAARTASGSAAYAYDSVGRLVRYRDPAGHGVQVDYDAGGRPQTVALPNGRKHTYAYDRNGQLSSITSDSGKAIRYSYDDAGRTTAIAYPNGTLTSYQYFSGFQIRSIATANAAGRILLRERYAYDSRGNVLSIETDGELPVGADMAEAFKGGLGRTEYKYDALNRVVEAAFPDGLRERFTYDASGNVIRSEIVSNKSEIGREQGSTSYEFDADQALVAAGDQRIGSDAAGNFCGELTNGQCSNKYDSWSRLTAWRDQTYRYDAEGRLLEWSGAGSGGHLVHFGSAIVGEQTLDKKSLRAFVPGPEPGLWSAAQAGNNDQFPIRSANGSLLAVTDSDGALVAACQYRTYAVHLSWAKDPEGAKCEFAGGRQLGPGTWFGNRVLASIGMRFLSRDPAGPDRDGNWYSYALANPLRFVDRTGANGTIIPAGGSVPPLNDNPAIRGLRSMAAGTPGYVPPRQMADRAVAEQIAAGFDRNAPLTGRAVAQDTLNRIGRGELQINVAPSGVANNPNEILRGGVVSTPGNTVANVYSNPVAGRPRDMALTTLHEGTHVEQLQRPRPVGQYLSQVPSEHVPNTQLHELGAELNRWRGDPTLETGEYVRLSDLPEYVAKKHTKVGADGTVTDLIPKSNPSEVKVTRSWPGTMQITEDGNIIPGNRSFEQRVEKLRNLQRQQAVDNVSRLPGKVPLEPRISSNTVDLAVSREVSAAEHVLQETRTIGARVANALDSAGDKAASKLAGLYDATASSLGRLGSKAAKVLSYLADTGAGRFARAVVPAVGQVAAAIGLMEGAHWLGQNVGEMAADVVINIRKKLDKALDALDKLGKDIAAQDTPPKKKKRLAELVNRGSAEPQQIGYAPLHDGPPGGSASNQPPGASAANPPGSSTGPAPTQTPGGLAPPQRPLGGSAANQPGQQPPREQGARPDQQPQQRPPEQRPPDRLPPNAPRSGALNQPRNNPPGAPAAPQRDFAGMCGSDFRQSVQRMLAGQLSGEQATQCNCYFWDKGGRPDTVLFNGRRAADLCAQSMASVAPPPPPPPPPPRPAAPPPPEPAKDKPADPPAAKPKEDKPTDWCAYFGQAPCPGLSPDQARQAIADAEFKKHLREELEKKKRELGPKFDEWANSPPSPDKPWRPPSPSSQPPVTGHIDPKPVTASPPASGSGGASNFFGAVANTLYGGAQALDRLNSHIK